jgi:transposase
MGWRRGQAYSQDLRDRVLASSGSARTVAARFGVSISYVVKARQRRDRHGETRPRPQRSHTPRLLAALHGAILSHVRAQPEATLNELRAWLLEVHGVHPSMGLMWTTLDRLGLTFKKTAARQRAGTRRYHRGTPTLARFAAPVEPVAIGLP